MIGLLLACALGSPSVAPCIAAATPESAPKRVAAANGNLTVVIDGPGPTADVDVPFTLAASLGDALGPFVYLWSCPQVGAVHTPTWPVRLMQPGTYRFSLEIVDAAEDVGWANATINATLGPVLATSATNRSSDAGVPTGIALAFSGGVGPYALDWQVVGGGSNGSAIANVAGTLLEPVWTNRTGPVWVTANLTDAVGGRASSAAWVATGFPYPSLTATVETPAAEVGAPARLAATVEGGVPPIRWAVLPEVPVRNASATTGTLDGDGTFPWNATVALAAPLNLTITATDALGVTVSANVSVPIVAPVNLSLAALNASASAGGTFNLSALIVGGIAPYDYQWALSNGPRSNGTLEAAGPLNWSAPAGTGGYVVALLTVRDAAGGSADAEVRLWVAAALAPAPALPASSADDGAAIVELTVLGVAAGAGGGVWAWRRRHVALLGDRGRQRQVEAFVGEAIRARPGIDEDALQGLGDAKGFHGEEIRAAVQREIAGGHIRTEERAGEPSYYGIGPPGTAPAPPATSPEAKP